MESETSRKVAFLIMGSDVHVLEQGPQWSNQVVIRAPCTVLAASLVTLKLNQASYVIIITHDGRIWLLDVLRLLQDNLRKTGCEVERADEQMDSDDIFGDLLNSKAPSDKSHSEFQDLKGRPCSSQRTPILGLASQHLLFTVDCVVIAAETMDNLVSVLVDTSGVTDVHIYKICADPQSDISEDRKIIRQVESFSTGLDSRCFHSYSMEKNRCLYFAKPERKNSTISTPSTSLRLLLVNNTSLSIPLQHFTALFGKEAACLNAPVLMLCTDSGCVYSYVLKSTGPKRLRLICQLDSQIVGILPVAVSKPAVEGAASKLNDVVSALASSLREHDASHSGSHDSTCLVVLSSTGKGCLFVTTTPENDCPNALVFCVPHQIKFCISHGKSVVYSTGKSVEACDLKLTQETVSCAVSVTPVMRTLMQKARILKLLPLASVSGSEGTVLNAVTSSFDLVPISTQPEEAGPDSLAKGTLQFKDILENIERCSLTFKALKKDSLNIDSILLQLNIFASLAQKKKTQESIAGSRSGYHLDTPEHTDALITCSLELLSTQNVYKRNWSLKIILHNTCAVSLSEDWVVLVTICDNGEGVFFPACDRFNQSYAVPLSSGIQCKSSINLVLPLDRLIEVHPVPLVDVEVSLILSFRDVNGGRTNVPQALLHKSMKVQIHQQKIDILHFFHKITDKNVNQKAGSRYSSFSSLSSRDDQWLHDELSKLALMRASGRMKDCPVQDKSQIFNIRVAWSELECKEHNISNSAQALAFLLKDSKILVDSRLGPHVQLEGPHGHLIMLMVYASTADNESTDDLSVSGSCPIVVTLKGEDAGLLLQTRAAIKSRLKISNSEASSLAPKSCEELKKQLIFLQGVQDDMCHVRSKLVSHKEDREESLKLICEMVDRSELLLTKSA